MVLRGSGSGSPGGGLVVDCFVGGGMAVVVGCGGCGGAVIG